jgi:hypothetical protein
MRKVFLSLALIIAGLVSNAQADTALASLEKRLSEYTIINQRLDFEKLFDYIHPSIYKIAPREQMIELFQKAYNSDEMTIGIDTIRNNRIGENFQFNGSSYRRVDYYMVMSLKFKDESRTRDSSFVETMVSNLREGFLGKSVSFDKAKKVFFIKGDGNLIAIKDSARSLWMFLSYEKGNPYASKLFPKEVVAHFKLDDE